MRKTTTILKTVIAMVAVGTLFSGCSQQEAQLAQSLVGSAASLATPNTSNTLNTLASPAGVGMAQSQVIGAQMLANPTVLGVGAVSTAISEHNKAQNKKAFGDVTDMYVNSDKMNSGMERMMVKAYNQKYGTKFTSMRQLQETEKIKGYNQKYGTKYSTLSELRVDYNKRNGTDFKTDTAFRRWMAENR